MQMPALPKRYHPASIWALYAIGLLPAVWTFYLGATGSADRQSGQDLRTLAGRMGSQVLDPDAADLSHPGCLWHQLGALPAGAGTSGLLVCGDAFFRLHGARQALAFDVIVEDVFKRWFITIGMAGFVLLIPLALTSNRCRSARLAQAGTNCTG
jgi:sulfoxide reductase heme-binding subunit YedZ